MSKLNTKFANVTFPETPYKPYAFITDMKTLKKGDLVVVDTAVGIKVAEFKEYIDTFPFVARSAKWIVQKIDVTKLNSFRNIDVSKILEQSIREQRKKELVDEMNKLSLKISLIQEELDEL